jgi:hypothetical protein
MDSSHYPPDKLDRESFFLINWGFVSLAVSGLLLLAVSTLLLTVAMHLLAVLLLVAFSTGVVSHMILSIPFTILCTNL